VVKILGALSVSAAGQVDGASDGCDEGEELAIRTLVRVLDEDPDLGARLDPRTLAIARRDLLARVVGFEARASLGSAEWRSHEDSLGLLVLDGLLVRRVGMLGRFGIELVGAGDVVRPWESEDGFSSVPTSASWRALERTSVAVLDDDFAVALGRFPGVMKEVLRRATRRADVLAHHLVLTQLPRVESRLLVVLWQLADRWGKATPHGVVLPLPLSHTTLGELVSAARPTVTLGLKLLAAQGLAAWQRSEGGWVLQGSPPAEARRSRLLGEGVLSDERSRLGLAQPVA
jgi:CRP/FNR family transcriptional regulator, cyclic AMP receptor protein